MAFDKGARIKVKKKCCRSAPRCKKCPVLWKKLSKRGRAERLSRRKYVALDKIRKRDRSV